MDSTSQVSINDTDSTAKFDSEDDEDDEDTPKASPQHSPQKMYSHSLPPAKHNLDVLNQFQTSGRTTRFETISNNYSESNPPPLQSFAKRVTFAGYVSPSKHSNNNRTEMADASLRNGAFDHQGNHTVSGYQWETGGQCGCDTGDATPDPLNLLHAGGTDQQFTMRKFLDPTRCYSSDEDGLESDHCDVDLNTQKQDNIHPSINVPNQRLTNSSVDFAEERADFQLDYNNRRYNSQTFLSIKASSQDEIFQQGSALDSSTGVIDSSSTQSSVTSQYEAQFQLGLANLDSEIAKLQNSLRSMNTKKSSHNLQR